MNPPGACLYYLHIKKALLGHPSFSNEAKKTLEKQNTDEKIADWLKHNKKELRVIDSLSFEYSFSMDPDTLELFPNLKFLFFLNPG